MELGLKSPTARLICIYPAPFCLARFMNDPRYTNSEPCLLTKAEMKAKLTKYRRANVYFADKSIRVDKNEDPVKDFDDFAYISRQTVVEIRTTRNIAEGDELFSDYGEDYGGGFGES